MDLKKIGKTIRAFCKDESGVTAVEYGIIAALIAGAIVAAVTTLGSSFAHIYANIANQIGT